MRDKKAPFQIVHWEKPIWNGAGPITNVNSVELGIWNGAGLKKFVFSGLSERDCFPNTFHFVVFFRKQKVLGRNDVVELR